MQKRVLVFRKSYAKDMGKTWVDADVIQIGHDRLTVRDVKGNPDGYNGTLCFNSRPFAAFTGSNKGAVEVTPIDIPSKALLKSIELNMSSFEALFSGVKLKLTVTWATHVLAMTRIHDDMKL